MMANLSGFPYGGQEANSTLEITASANGTPGANFPTGAANVLSYLTLVLYLTTFVFGLTGNGLVLYVIAYFTNVRRKSVANYYIWNLALADELFIITLPLFCYATFTKDWVFGEAVCKIAYVIRDINKFASVFTLVALSVDRYLATHHTLASLRTVRSGKIVCVCIWIASSIIMSPLWIYATVKTREKGTHSCRINWQLETQGIGPFAAWTYINLLLGFVIPLVVIALSYILLMTRMSKIMRCRSSSRIKTPNRKLTKTVLVVVVTFLVCQAPYQVIELVSFNKQKESYEQGNSQVVKSNHSKRDLAIFMYVNFIAQILVFVSSCCNPILYGVLNENYRKLYKLVICRCRRNTRNSAAAVETNGELPSLDEAPYEPIKFKIQFMFHPPCARKNKRNRGHHRKVADDEQQSCKENDMTMMTTFA